MVYILRYIELYQLPIYCFEEIIIIINITMNIKISVNFVLVHKNYYLVLNISIFLYQIFCFNMFVIFL